MRQFITILATSSPMIGAAITDTTPISIGLVVVVVALVWQTSAKAQEMTDRMKTLEDTIRRLRCQHCNLTNET